jgi:hypothetical protein
LLFFPSIYFATKIFLHVQDRVWEGDEICDISVFREISPNDQTIGESRKTCTSLSRLFIILKHKTFVVCAMGLSNLFFIITAIQYWASDYLANVLDEKDEYKRNLSFIIICISSPTLGVLTGGYISQKTGGYESRNSIFVCIVLSLIASCFSLLVPFANDIYYFTLYLWFGLFFGGAIVPSITGIILTSIPPKLRGSANSITNVYTTMFGYLPAPIVYGIIYESYKITHPRLAMTVIMYFSLIATIMFIIGSVFQKNLRGSISSRGRSKSTFSGNVARIFVNMYLDNVKINYTFTENFNGNVLEKSEIVSFTSNEEYNNYSGPYLFVPNSTVDNNNFSNSDDYNKQVRRVEDIQGIVTNTDSPTRKSKMQVVGFTTTTAI